VTKTQAPTTNTLAAAALGLLLLANGRAAFAAEPTAEKAPVEPTTVEAATRVLDLRTYPVPEGAQVSSSMHTLAILMFEAKGGVKESYELQRKQLVDRGWKELPGTYLEDTTASGHFSKDGFVVAASASPAFSDPKKAGWSSVTLINHGNVVLAELPAPAGVKNFYSNPSEASYSTEANVADTAAACRKLLLADGWAPYGTASSDPQSPMMYFKRNAIRLMAWISSAPALGNKTIIKYSADLLSADLPIPPDVPDPRYDDSDKTVRFDAPDGQADAIIAFYQKQFAKQGWKATTDRPIVDDQKETQFLVFRNPQGDMISLDLAKYNDIVRVKVEHQSAAEVAEADRRHKEEAERQRQKLAKMNIKIKVAVPLPAMAAKIEQEKPDRFEFALATGEGPAAFRFFKDHFSKLGWEEEDGTRAEKHTGSMFFKKDEAQIRFKYFDSGLSDAEISVSGTSQMVFEPQPALDKSPRNDAPKTAKKSSLADIPGMPKLPPGVELPDSPEVNELLKALKAAGVEAPTATKKAVPNSAAKSKSATAKGAPAASGPVKVADIPMPSDLASVEYKKTVKMIEITSPSDARTLATFFVDALTERGWVKASPGLVTDSSAILKHTKGDAQLTIFVHGKDGASDATLMCKGVVWDVVPQSKVAAKKPARKPATAPAAGSRVASKSSKPVGSTTEPAAKTSPMPTGGTQVAGPRIAVADQKQSGASIIVGDQTYKLDYGVAYEAKSNDDPVTVVLMSVKPIATEKLVALLRAGKDAGDAAGFDPHLKLQFDANGKLSYLFLYADGLSVNLGGPDPETVKAEIAVKDGRARGRAVMEKPTDFFKKQYRFDAPFDAKLATGSAGTPGAAPTAPGGDELVAEEHDGVPFPVTTSNRSSSNSRYRKSVEAVVPADLPAVVKFYRKELASRGWKEDVKAAKLTPESALLTFTGTEGGMTVRLSRKDNDVAVNLASRDPAKAKAAGILPQPNRARLVLGNAGDRNAVVVINGQEYKVAAGTGAKDPKDGTSLNVLPGKYSFTIKSPGQPDATEDLNVSADETWGVIVLPTGGHFADQLY